MKKMRVSKFVALFLSLIMIVGLFAGCNKSKETDDKPAVSETDETNDDTGNTGNTDGEDNSESDAEPTEVAEGEIPEEIFPGGDLGGVTIKLLNSNNISNADPNANGIEDYQKEERQTKLDAIQKKYNVKIEFVPNPTDVWDDTPKEVIAAYAAGQPVADVMDASRMWVTSYVSNDILYDMTDIMGDLPYAKEYVDNGTWLNKNWGIGCGIGGEGMLYNRKMIEDAGMEKTPTELFAEGKWSYNDFYDYCVELKSKLGENEYPFYIDPYYWLLFSPGANGTMLVNSDGTLNYTSDAIIENMNFLQKLYDANLVRWPNKTESGAYSTWGTPGVTFDKGVEVAMTHRASWQAGFLVGVVDFGYVPYPWGSNVTVENVGQPDAYKTISDNYATMYYDAQTIVMTKGIEEKADPAIVSMMVTELVNWEFIVEEYYYGLPEVEEVDYRFFNDELDAVLYEWALTRERFEPAASLFNQGVLSLNVEEIYFLGGSVRSVMESYYQTDAASMKEAGYVVN